MLPNKEQAQQAKTEEEKKKDIDAVLKGEEWKKDKVTVVKGKHEREEDPYASLAKPKKGKVSSILYRRNNKPPNNNKRLNPNQPTS